MYGQIEHEFPDFVNSTDKSSKIYLLTVSDDLDYDWSCLLSYNSLTHVRFTRLKWSLMSETYYWDL